jgi:quercetin dioxygenase-like cupin family protein
MQDTGGSAPQVRTPDWSRTTYERWMESQGVPVVRGLAVADLRRVPVAPWERMGVPGTFVKLEGSESINDAYILELPPGASSAPQRHVFEELVYILDGRGATTVWNQDGAKQSFE